MSVNGRVKVGEAEIRKPYNVSLTYRNKGVKETGAFRCLGG